LKKYGGLAVATHITLSVGFYLGCFLLIKKGVDMKKILKYFKITETKFSEGASNAGGAYIVYKAIMPLRLGVTAATVPILANYLGR
jgi:hypothetical protein